ncbi:hypothetical protein MLD38_019381 [Melastoma candidum]|uniref:Uncharacterized protein n=1 Tax=Melastoma candidum TaxID=119954 RepID=A0ACB9QW95_9MYRT|nr:hypothetical protein MLD38_019381 [Melastoma candidum]
MISFEIRFPWMGESYGSHLVVGICNGLVLLQRDYEKPKLSLWNPITREIRKIRNVIECLCYCNTDYGFSFVRSSDEYEIVMVHRPMALQKYCLLAVFEAQYMEDGPSATSRRNYF